MGENIWDWFLPIRPSRGDGARFPYNEKVVKKLRERARRIVAGQRVGEIAQTTAAEERPNEGYGGLSAAI